jgi:hypothetical protein
MLMPRIGKRHVKMGKRASKVHIAIAKKSKTMTNSLRLNGFCHNIICFHQPSPQEFKDSCPTPAASIRMGSLSISIHQIRMCRTQLVKSKSLAQL